MSTPFFFRPASHDIGRRGGATTWSRVAFCAALDYRGEYLVGGRAEG
jgi:hypothetical protein